MVQLVDQLIKTRVQDCTENDQGRNLLQGGGIRYPAELCNPKSISLRKISIVIKMVQNVMLTLEQVDPRVSSFPSPGASRGH